MCDVPTSVGSVRKGNGRERRPMAVTRGGEGEEKSTAGGSKERDGLEDGAAVAARHAKNSEAPECQDGRHGGWCRVPPSTRAQAGAQRLVKATARQVALRLPSFVKRSAS